MFANDKSFVFYNFLSSDYNNGLEENIGYTRWLLLFHNKFICIFLKLQLTWCLQYMLAYMELNIYTFKLSLQEKLILWFICCDHHQNKKYITIDDNIICMYMYLKINIQYLLGHSMPNHPKSEKFPGWPSQILMKIGSNAHLRIWWPHAKKFCHLAISFIFIVTYIQGGVFPISYSRCRIWMIACFKMMIIFVFFKLSKWKFILYQIVILEIEFWHHLVSICNTVKDMAN